ADHHADDLFAVGVAHLHGADVMAVAEDGHAVGDAEDLLQAVADVDDADAALPEGADQVEQVCQLVLGEGGGRLVHRDDHRVAGSGLGDLDHLLLGNGEAAHLLAHVDADAEAVHEALGIAVELAEVDEPGDDGARLAAEEDVFGGAEVRDQVEFLVDDVDAEVHRPLGGIDHDGLAVENNLAAVRLLGAGQDLHERRLAGAVLADEGVDLAGTHLEADAVERDDTRVALADPAHLEEGSGGGGHALRLAAGGRGTCGECRVQNVECRMGTSRSGPFYTLHSALRI